MDADVAVIGLGAMGSMAAWRLASRGALVIGFDRFSPPHIHGSSHGESRIFRLSSYEGNQYVPLAEEALIWWKQLGQESQKPVFHETGRLYIAAPDSQIFRSMLKSLQVWNLPHENLSRMDVEERYPQHRLYPDDIYMFEFGAGFLAPEQAITAALDQAKSRGANIVPNVSIEAIESVSGGLALRSGEKLWRVRHLVIATGGWLPELVPAMRDHFQVERQVQIWLDLNQPEMFTPERFPVFLRCLSGDQQLYGFPSMDGQTIKVGVHHGGRMFLSPSAIDGTVHAADTEVIKRFATDNLRGVSPTVHTTAVCFYPIATDDHFVIGPVPGQPAITILGATSGHGFKFASCLGDIAADLALDGQTKRDISLFRPDRYIN